MKKIFLLTFILLISLYPAKNEFKIGLTASTTIYGWSYFYTYGATTSFSSMRVDLDSVKVAGYYMFDLSFLKNVEAHFGIGVGTFYYMPDTWTLKTPIGVSYEFKKFDVFLDFIPAFSLLSNAQMGSLGFSDTIRGGVRYIF